MKNMQHISKKRKKKIEDSKLLSSIARPLVFTKR